MNKDYRHAHEVKEIVDRIKPEFAGRPPDIVGAALADLLAMWLAGHQGPGADKFREEMLQMHLAAVRKLIPVNDAVIKAETPGKP